MSVVGSFILILACDGKANDAAVEELNRRVSGIQSLHCFVRVDQHAGGYKAFQADVYMLAGNYLTLEDVATEIALTQWPTPDDVQLCHQAEEDDGFVLYDFERIMIIARRKGDPMPTITKIDTDNIGSVTEEHPRDLRFLDGKLQQRWVMFDHTTRRTSQEWRDVPVAHSS